MNTKKVIINGKTLHAVKVKSITEAGEKQVYDIEVKNSHSFFANDILVHNCEYHQVLDHYGKKYGEELYRFKESFLHYKHKKLFTSASSPNKRTLRGRSRFEFAIDELGWFDASLDSKDKVRISADEIYGALDRSMKTVLSASKRLFLQGNYSITPAIGFNISSPASYDDKIMTLSRVHQNSRVVLSIHLPTWEFNPKEPKSNFKKEYIENPVRAERDFGANPPMAASPFIENTNNIVNCFNSSTNSCTYEYDHKRVEGKVYRYAKLSPRPKGDLYPAVLSIDAGYSNNSFAMAVGYRKDKLVRTPLLVEISPDSGHNVLNYSLIFKYCVVPIIQAMNVKFVCADRWNSLFLLHELEENYDVKVQQYSVKYADFTLFKSYLEVENSRLSFPTLEMQPKQILRVPASEYKEKFLYKPVSHLFSQIFTVEDKGKTVDKGKNRTDDLFRAVVLGHRFLLDEKWTSENLIGDKMKNSNRGIVSLAGDGPASYVSSTGKGIASLGD